MKRIFASKKALATYPFAIVLFFVCSILFFCLICSSKTENIVPGLMGFLFPFSLFCILLLSLNRSACIIWVEDGIVKRKGLIRGFYKECPISSIKKVTLHHIHRQGTFIYLVDDSTEEYKKLSPIRKDSYICFKKTRKNLEFLSEFWQDGIQE